MSKTDRYSVFITGATGAIGQALALAYSQAGVHLILAGQRSTVLETLASQCVACGATVQIVQIDLRNTDELRLWCRAQFDANCPDLLIANAGVNINLTDDPAGERWEDIERLLDVNLRSTQALVNCILPYYRTRGLGQIALVSSLAAYYGLPMTPSYCASKAAIKAYGEALRSWLAPEGIKVNVIMPGYVSSPMCDAMPGPKPFLWTPERAAKTIRRGLENNKARISFPFPLNWGSWWLAVLPAGISQRILHWIGYRA